MIRIAIIGDIGSGKSHVAKLFGGPVFNADIEVSKLYRTSKKCYLKLKKILPNYVTSFPVNKNNLSKAILANKKNLKKITKIIHPEIRLKMNKFMQKYKNRKFVVLDIPLLMENKINREKDILIFVEANKKEIYKRLKKRQNFNLKIVKTLKKLQLPVEIKKKKSDFVVKNNFKSRSIKKNVKRVMKKIFIYA